MKRIDVLDKGYVRLVTWTPHNMAELDEILWDYKLGVVETMYSLINSWGNDDLAFVNAAKTSFQKESKELDPAAIKLERSLAKYNESLPFRHAMVTFEISAPYMVVRQWFKYVVGSEHGPTTASLLGIPMELIEALCDGGDDFKFGGDTFSVRSEVSRRYVTIEPEFYIPAPEQWRGAPDNKKQGSQGVVKEEYGIEQTEWMNKNIDQAMSYYYATLTNGTCAEQARLFLPFYAMYVHWRWSASLQAVTHFLNQRLEHKAQYEIQQYAQAVYDLIKPIYPYAIKFLVDKELGE
jgi:thymidylate synthase (FAD)